MRKLIIKTALITLGVAIVVAFALFGILSLASPASLVEFTRSMGMVELSGEYAYSAYERGADVSYLDYSVDIAYNFGYYEESVRRYEKLFTDEKFPELCVDKDKNTGVSTEYVSYLSGGYAQYVSGKYVTALYKTGEKEKAIMFAFSVTPESFPVNNPTIALALCAVQSEDEEFCTRLASLLRESNFASTEHGQKIINMLENS